MFQKFFDLTNVKDQSGKLLLKVYIVSMLVPDIDHAMLILHGEKGSAKSTLQTIIKKLIDPAKPSLITIPTDKNEFVQQMSHNYVAYYDNIKYTPKWFPDEVCKAATGVGNTKRKLYTNDEDIVYEYRRCLGFNGINNSLTEPDALDRSILIQLDRINRENNKVKSRIFTKFEELQPKLLGYIFDILSKALSIKDSIHLKELPRLGDFTVWGEAIALAMGYQPLEFMNAYYENLGKQNIDVIEAHPLGLTISRLFDSLQENNESEWIVSTEEFFEKLTEIAVLTKINTDGRLWPKSTNSLTRTLNKIKSNLLEGLGIEVTIDRVTAGNSKYKKNTSITKIQKISPLPPLPPLDQNQAQLLTHFGGDLLNGGGTMPPQTEIPPPDVEEIQAQVTSDIDNSGDSGHSGGIFGNSLQASQQDNLEYNKTNLRRTITSKGVTFFNCPQCATQNIHPEEIIRHIKEKHSSNPDKPSVETNLGEAKSDEGVPQ